MRNDRIDLGRTDPPRRKLAALASHVLLVVAFGFGGFAPTSCRPPGSP
jgi:hypothetical protein